METKGQLIFTEEELPQRSEAWHERRKKTIGASDIATILNLLPKKEKPKTFWKRKIGKLKPKTQTALMEHGKNLENEALNVATALLKSEWSDVEFHKFFAYDPEFPYISCSFDGVDLKNGLVLELKCPYTYYTFKKMLENGIPDYYYPQIQLQLHIAYQLWGITNGIFFAYYPEGAYIMDDDYVERKHTYYGEGVVYDPAYCRRMLRVAEWVNNAILTKTWDDDAYASVLNGFKNGHV